MELIKEINHHISNNSKHKDRMLRFNKQFMKDNHSIH
jgi:hypothetical protein